MGSSTRTTPPEGCCTTTVQGAKEGLSMGGSYRHSYGSEGRAGEAINIGYELRAKRAHGAFGTWSEKLVALHLLRRRKMSNASCKAFGPREYDRRMVCTVRRKQGTIVMILVGLELERTVVVRLHGGVGSGDQVRDHLQWVKLPMPSERSRKVCWCPPCNG